MAEYTYYPDGTIRSLQSGSLYTEYAYDADRNLTGLKTMLGDQVLADNRYAYDHNGNRTEKKQPGGVTRYTYDDLNQLTKVEYPGYTEELYYDKAGNRSRRIAGGVEEEYRYDPANHLTEYTKGGTTTTFTYDNAGNLTADNKARYTYDLFNRTEKVETFDSHVQINHYDAEGLRSGIEEDGRLVQFIFRGQEVVTELETEKSMTRFIRGYELIASDADSARTYYHYASDEMGSITHVIAGEDILNRYEYDARGNLTFCEEKVENRFKFNGQQYDPVSQQYYLRARYYNPVIGRFTQEDTYRGDGLNLYAYCRNNPVYYADPSGHQPNCVKDAARKYMEQGMSPEEAYRKAYAEHAETKLADAENLTPQERYRLEERQRRLQGEETSASPTPESGLVSPETVLDTSDNRPSNPEADGPDNNNRETSNGRDYSKDFEDLAAYRRQQGMPVAGSADDDATAAKLIMGDAEYYGMNAHGKQNEIKKVFSVNAQTATHAEGDVFYQAKVAGNTNTTEILITDRRACTACGLNGGIRSLARQVGITDLTVVSPGYEPIHFNPQVKPNPNPFK